MPDCQFCRIADGAAPAHLIYEDDRTVAFLDANPAVEGHALVAPRTHVEDLLTASELTSGAAFRTVRAVAGAMERALDPDGFSVFHTSGVPVGRITHAHVHLLPRAADDDISIALTRGELDEAAADRLAATIRAEL